MHNLQKDVVVEPVNPIPNRLGHVTYNERADSALTW